MEEIYELMRKYAKKEVRKPYLPDEYRRAEIVRR